MKKLLVFIAIALIYILLAGLYGALHDQLSYTISPEYFSRFKFEQFHLIPKPNVNPRITVAIIGFIATWWMGFIAAIIIGSNGFRYPSAGLMFRRSMQAMGIMLGIALVFALLGLLSGHFYFSTLDREALTGWYIPEDLDDYKAFVTVGSLHNGSYMGGAIGILTAAFWQIRKSKRAKKAAKKGK